jgi:hypothetical protein
VNEFILEFAPTPCQARVLHGLVDPEAEVAAGIARFIRGGSY